MYKVLLIWMCSISMLVGQSETSVSKIQPTIMVIPFAKKGQSIRTVLENNELARVATTKVKEGFDTRGVNTIDLRAKLKQVNNTNVINDGAAQDMKSQVIQLSGADIYVEVEANANYASSGNSVTVIMTAYDAFSGESLANKVSNSPSFYTKNFEKLTSKAVDKDIEEFLNVIQSKFDVIVEEGRSVVFDISIEDLADYDFDREMEGDLFLSEVIEEWIAENAYKGYYHIQGTSEYKMIFDIVKVPLVDERGSPFRMSKLANNFKRFLKKQGIACDRTVQGGNLVFVLK